jgi:hypothetical protein
MMAQASGVGLMKNDTSQSIMTTLLYVEDPRVGGNSQLFEDTEEGFARAVKYARRLHRLRLGSIQGGIDVFRVTVGEPFRNAPVVWDVSKCWAKRPSLD